MSVKLDVSMCRDMNLVGQCCVALFVALLTSTRNHSIYTVPQAKPIQSHTKHVTHVAK